MSWTDLAKCRGAMVVTQTEKFGSRATFHLCKVYKGSGDDYPLLPAETAPQGEST